MAWRATARSGVDAEVERACRQVGFDEPEREGGGRAHLLQVGGPAGEDGAELPVVHRHFAQHGRQGTEPEPRTGAGVLHPAVDEVLDVACRAAAQMPHEWVGGDGGHVVLLYRRYDENISSTGI